MDNQEAIEIPPEVLPTKNYRGKMGHEETAKVLELHARGLNTVEIAKAIGRTHPTISAVIKQFQPFLELTKEVPQYRQVRRDLLTAAEMQAVRSVLDEEKHKRANLRDSAYALKEISTVRRLEENLSTSNQSVKVSWQSVSLPKIGENSGE